MSYENDKDLGNINLGKSESVAKSESIPIKMVYTNPQIPNQQHVNVNYNTIYEIPRFEYPKFRYDYGWPDYSYTRPLYVERYPNPYKVREDDRISQFFIGSATVVGLFILYKILEKNK
jgi:hypothetical protein